MKKTQRVRLLVAVGGMLCLLCLLYTSGIRTLGLQSHNLTR